MLFSFNMTDINFDQFKQEIRVAENYLRADVNRLSSSDGVPLSKVRASDGLAVLDASRKESILQQFGRRSLSSQEAPRVSWRVDDYEERAVYDRSTFDDASVSTDPFWKEGGRSNAPSAAGSAVSGNYSTLDPPPSIDPAMGRYSKPSEREKLIQRLLTDHDRADSQVSGINPNPPKDSTSPSVRSSGAEHPNPYTSQSSPLPSSHAPTDSPDSLDTTSDDVNILFFASDLNLSLEVEGSAQAPSHAVSHPVSARNRDRYYQLESPDVIREHHPEEDTFTRLTRDVRGSSDPRASAWDIDIKTINNTDSTDNIRPSSLPPRKSSLTDYQAVLGSNVSLPGKGNSRGDTEDEGHSYLKSFERHASGSAGVVESSPRYRYEGTEESEGQDGEGDEGGEGIPVQTGSIQTGSRGSARGSIGSTRSTMRSAVKPDKKRIHKTKEQLQLEAEVSFQQLYDFKPSSSTNDSKSTDNRKDGGAGGTDRVEALQRWYKKSRENREKQKKDFQQLEMMNCTFRPQITKMGTRVQSKGQFPVFSAVEYLSGGTGYSPKDPPVGQGSQGGLGGRKGAGAAVETSMRLHEEAEQRSAQQRWLEKQVEEARLAQFTFQPSINPATVSYMESIEHRPIHERVGELQKEREDRRRTLKQTHEDSLVELTFTPQIDARSRRIAEKRLESDGKERSKGAGEQRWGGERGEDKEESSSETRREARGEALRGAVEQGEP